MAIDMVRGYGMIPYGYGLYGYGLTLTGENDGEIAPLTVNATPQPLAGSAGVTADAQPYDLLALQSGQATAGVAAEVDALDMSMMGEELVATARRPFPYLVTWRSP